MSKKQIPTAAINALKVGDIPAAVKATAEANPKLSRLKICALLGREVNNGKYPKIPVADPDGWDSEFAKYHPEVMDVEDLDYYAKRPFGASSNKQCLGKLPDNMENKGFTVSSVSSFATGGCAIMGFVGLILIFFYPAIGFLVMGGGLMWQAIANLNSARKEEAEQELAEHAKETTPAEATVGQWCVVRGKLQTGESVTSVTADGPLAYLHVAVEHSALRSKSVGEDSTVSWWGWDVYHSRREMTPARIEADGSQLELLKEDFDFLPFTHAAQPVNKDDAEHEAGEESLRNLAVKGRSEYGVGTTRMEQHTASEFLLDDGLHTSRTRDGVSVTVRSLAVGDDVWAGGYVWQDADGGKVMGAHLYNLGPDDMNVIFLNDHDWRAQFAESEAEADTAAKSVYGWMICGALILIWATYIIVADIGPEVRGWLRDFLEAMGEE